MKTNIENILFAIFCIGAAAIFYALFANKSIVALIGTAVVTTCLVLGYFIERIDKKNDTSDKNS